ncbi:MAG: CBS domain-containing protein [Proteobacteria bacterium]|nr:CBS domain-containing protein [Pseudomonadota bacterium]MBU1741118.1 CBS domain-containing protein [Pseudomonadota bacterium]
MKLKHWMTTDPLTVTPDTSLMDARKLMEDHRIRRLPVVDKKGKLKGIVTWRNISEASPSAATTLSVHEINYLVAKMTVSEVMNKEVRTMTPDDTMFEPLRLGVREGIGAFPVVDDGKLVGIVTETEIIRAMMEIFGVMDRDSWLIALTNVDLELGGFRQIADILDKYPVTILGMFSLPHRRTELSRVFIRMRGKGVDDVKKALVDAGYEIED